MDPGHSHLLIHELFEERAAMAPEGAAVYEGDRLITLSELESRAKLLAGGLRSRGIGKGCSVGLHIERSIDWVVAILAILKANAAVVPLPPSHPVDWLRDILAFSALDGVIENTETPLHPSIPANRIHLAEQSPVGVEEIEGTPGRAEQAAFVLCSSGSTGQPKMIVRSHQSFFHRLRWTWEQHPFAAGEVGCQKAHMTTTHSIYELFEPLLSGIPVVIIPDRDVRDLELFWDTIRTRGISRLLIVPSALRASLDRPGFEAPPLKVLVLMGEYVPPGLAERTAAAFPERTRIYSIYGSTEASSTLVSDIRGGLQPGAELPLGRPISPDVRPQVLGVDLEPVAPGQVGRLYMAGTALFTEYFRDPALTASVFVNAPRQGEPLYDTHDQVRLLPDGNLQFIGRADHTVKIRGFRVDLPEVERAISLARDVSQAAVMVTEGSAGGSSLVGFFVPASVDRFSVYQTLRERLPAFMVPSALVGLDAFPLTASGKVDRLRLLAEYEGQSGGPSTHRTLSSTERRVREVWERVLGHGRFELDDSFFEVGGDSLSVFSLAHGLHDTFGLGGSQLAEQSIYGTPTIEELAARIDGVLAGRPSQPEKVTPLLVSLRKGTDAARPPFFLISSAGGTLGAYGKLTRALQTSREIIGVRDPFNWGERDPTEGFHHWVGLYVEAIRERQPNGPYFLGAYSSAGAFGYEIGRRLRQDGQEVPLLALIDPLALDRRGRWSYGYWALRATYMRPSYRELVRLFGWSRLPVLRMLGVFRSAKNRDTDTLSADQLREIVEYATRSEGHLMTFATLLELNTDLPFSMNAEDFSGADPDQYMAVLQSHVLSVTPDVDPATLERISIQYELQVRAQHAYELLPYDGPVLLVEPATPYTGLLEAQFRPHVRRLRTRAVALGPPSERTRRLMERMGSLQAHYRCMRDDGFVQGLAAELDVHLEGN